MKITITIINSNVDDEVTDRASRIVEEKMFAMQMMYKISIHIEITNFNL